MLDLSVNKDCAIVLDVVGDTVPIGEIVSNIGDDVGVVAEGDVDTVAEGDSDSIGEFVLISGTCVGTARDTGDALGLFDIISNRSPKASILRSC